jgi:hypothetical protein
MPFSAQTSQDSIQNHLPQKTSAAAAAMESVSASSGPVAAAAQNGTLAFGYSGSGFLLFYFVGVTSVLHSLGLIINTTKLAGASGGSINSASACAGVSIPTQFQALRESARTCRPTKGCRGFLDSAVSKELSSTLPSDTAQRCSGRLFVAVTQAQLQGLPDTPLLLGSNWTDRQQVLYALRASSYIPVQSGRSATFALGFLQPPVEAYDGGFSVQVPCPPGEGLCDSKPQGEAP